MSVRREASILRSVRSVARWVRLLMVEYAVAEDERHTTWMSRGRDASDFEYGEGLVSAWSLDLDAELWCVVSLFGSWN
jgi:hypothetical protein